MPNVDHLSDRSQAVRRARCVRHDGLAGIGLVVDAHHEHRGVVLRRSRHHDALRAGLDVGLGFLLGQEQAGRLNDVLGAHFVPLQVGGILLGRYADRVAVDNQRAVLHLDRALELAVHRVVTKHISHVVYRNQVVDADDFHIVLGHGRTEHQTSDTSEAVDTHFNL